MCLTQLTDMYISCQNNGLPKHWLDLQKQLSFIYLKSSCVNCFSSILGTLLRCLWDNVLRCLINGFVRHCLDLQKTVFQASWKYLRKISCCFDKTAIRHFVNVFWPIGERCKYFLRMNRKIRFLSLFTKNTYAIINPELLNSQEHK